MYSLLFGSIGHSSAIIDHCRARKLGFLHSWCYRNSHSDRAMASEHRWRSDVLERCRSDVDHLDDQQRAIHEQWIRVSSSVHQCCRIGHQCISHVDSASASISDVESDPDHGDSRHRCFVHSIIVRISHSHGSMASYSDTLTNHVERLHRVADHCMTMSITERQCGYPLLLLDFRRLVCLAQEGATR